MAVGPDALASRFTDADSVSGAALPTYYGVDVVVTVLAAFVASGVRAQARTAYKIINPT